MQVTAHQVRKSVNAKYVLWCGEMVVRVMQHTGVHGYHSAAIVVERMDDPIEVRSNQWYTDEARATDKPRAPMLEWIAQQLTELSTGTELNSGFNGDVEGLLKAV